jgi:hypothetical protein
MITSELAFVLPSRDLINAANNTSHPFRNGS